MNDHPNSLFAGDDQAEPAITHVRLPPPPPLPTAAPADVGIGKTDTSFKTKPRAEPRPECGDDFFGADSDCLVVHAQDAISVYENTFGAIVIRRERGWDENDDVIITVRPECLAALIAALERYLPSDKDDPSHG